MSAYSFAATNRPLPNEDAMVILTQNWV